MMEDHRSSRDPSQPASGARDGKAEPTLWTTAQWLANAIRWAHFEVGTDADACAAHVLRRADDCGLALTGKLLFLDESGVLQPVGNATYGEPAPTPQVPGESSRDDQKPFETNPTEGSET